MQDEFIFKVEGTGVLPCAQIVLTSIAILREKLKLINEAIRTEEELDPMRADDQPETAAT